MREPGLSAATSFPSFPTTLEQVDRGRRRDASTPSISARIPPKLYMTSTRRLVQEKQRSRCPGKARIRRDVRGVIFSFARAAAAAAAGVFSVRFFVPISTYLLRRVPRRRAALGARLGALERDDASDAWNRCWKRERKRAEKREGELTNCKGKKKKTRLVPRSARALLDSSGPILPVIWRRHVSFVFSLSLGARRRGREQASGARELGRKCDDDERRPTPTLAILNSPFFFAIVTTLRVPEVETAGDREGAAMVMRDPHTEDLRRAAIGIEAESSRERVEEEEGRKREKSGKKEPRESFFFYFSSLRRFELRSIPSSFRTLRAHDRAPRRRRRPPSPQQRVNLGVDARAWFYLFSKKVREKREKEGGACSRRHHLVP